MDCTNSISGPSSPNISSTPLSQSSKQVSAPPRRPDPCRPLWRRESAKNTAERTRGASSTPCRPPPALFTPGCRSGPMRPKLNKAQTQACCDMSAISSNDADAKLQAPFLKKRIHQNWQRSESSLVYSVEFWDVSLSVNGSCSKKWFEFHRYNSQKKLKVRLVDIGMIYILWITIKRQSSKSLLRWTHIGQGGFQ